MRFGFFEFAVIVVLLILLFGGRRTGRMLGKTYGTYRKVDQTRNELKSKFSLDQLLQLEHDKDKDKNKEQ